MTTKSFGMITNPKNIEYLSVNFYFLVRLNEGYLEAHRDGY